MSKLGAPTYHRRGRRWAKIALIAGPVDQRPYRYSVALGVKGCVLAQSLELCELRKQAEAVAQEWLWALNCQRRRE